MLSVILPLSVAAVGAVADSGGPQTCADSIRIDASPKDARALRSMLRQSSLAALRNESCQDYSAQLTRSENGWAVTMSSSMSEHRFERNVTSLRHASTWIESWTQSGFAPATDDNEARTSDSSALDSMEQSGTNSGGSLASPASTPMPVAAVAAMSAPAPMQVFLGAGPLAALTSKGYGLVGGALYAGLPARRSPWLGAELGVATQLDVHGEDYRRVFLAGPALGANVALSDRLRLRPALTVGVFGSVAHHGTATGHTAALFAGLCGDLELEVSTHAALAFGLEGRWLLESVFGSTSASISTPPCNDDDCEDIPTATATVPAGLGAWWGALRFGFVWHFEGHS